MENPEALTVRGLEYFAYWQFCYALAIGFVKSSICVALLRITPEKCYRIPLWIIIASAGCTSLGGLISLFTLCRPITANWNPGTGECAPRQIIATLSYMISVLAIVTDLFCAVVPWFIIRNLQMPRRSKYSILAVLALGVVASLGSAMRIPYLTAYSATKDHLREFNDASSIERQTLTRSRRILVHSIVVINRERFGARRRIHRATGKTIQVFSRHFDQLV